MSITNTMIINCDDCYYERFSLITESLLRIRREAKCRGWVRKHRRDICPSCVSAATAPAQCESQHA